MNRAKAAMTEKPKKEKKAPRKHGKKPHRMTIRHAASGGYIAQHEFKHDPMSGEQPMEPEEHALPDMEALQAHVANHMEPDGDEGEQA